MKPPRRCIGCLEEIELHTINTRMYDHAFTGVYSLDNREFKLRTCELAWDLIEMSNTFQPKSNEDP